MADHPTPQGNEETVEARALKPCPFCDAQLSIRTGANPYGRCETAGCWLNERKMTVPLHDREQVEAWNTRAALAPPIREHGEAELSQELRNIREQFAGIAALHPNEQPHYPNGVRPFGTGDLRHVIEVLNTAIAALSAQPVKDAVHKCGVCSAVRDSREELGQHIFAEHTLAPSPKSPASVGLDPASDAADLLDQYAGYIRTVKADELERHPYLPHVEQVAEDLRASARGQS
jgi:hypothetical protein